VIAIASFIIDNPDCQVFRIATDSDKERRDLCYWKQQRESYSPAGKNIIYSYRSKDLFQFSISKDYISKITLVDQRNRVNRQSRCNYRYPYFVISER